MDNLKQTIETVRGRLKEYRERYQKSEESVRYQLINPVLKGLEWDPESPEDVQPNIASDEGIPDYSLFKHGKKVLFIEAKKLSIDVGQGEVVRKLANYCFGEGMKYGVLTNGSTWLLLRAFQEGTTTTQRKVWTTNVESDDAATIVRRLATISKKNVENIELLTKRLQTMDEVWQDLLDNVQLMVSGLCLAFEDRLKERYPDFWPVENADVEDFVAERVRELVERSEREEDGEGGEADAGESPGLPSDIQRMIIGDETIPIIHIYEILVNTANWLIRQGKLRAGDCPILPGPKSRNRYLVHKEPKHKSGIGFLGGKQLSNGLWIETHYSRERTIDRARQLLAKYKYPDKTLRIAGHN